MSEKCMWWRWILTSFLNAAPAYVGTTESPIFIQFLTGNDGCLRRMCSRISTPFCNEWPRRVIWQKSLNLFTPDVYTLSLSAYPDVLVHPRLALVCDFKLFWDCMCAICGVSRRSTTYWCEPQGLLHGLMAYIPKISKNMDAVFTAGESSSTFTGLTGSWTVLVM